ncbi:hypothetical protein TSAR_001412 [Trichomalopsis sarcophagae]|uniref:Reverse transcriptase domain-containing protein n=1 Tax=Trichomalopsis sarcophagae TaxID=543379 RepID=A0A232EHH7_9HYME|nr:hypothetical protein TSAR_001412 [Trichomalopsis sarcophagae]
MIFIFRAVRIKRLILRTKQGKVGILPTSWKRTIVRLLPKKSVAVSFQISEYVENNKLLEKFQSNFGRSYSTHAALICIEDEFREAINDSCISLPVGIDFSSAFDLIQIPAVLVNKLRSLGFSGGACEWATSYLTDRTQVVAFPGGKRLQPCTRLSGVPQGSFLGPPFFALTINDLPRALKHSKHHLYADNLVIYASDRMCDAREIVSRIINNLENISKWPCYLYRKNTGSVDWLSRFNK